jgi:hypothetical protein
MARYKERENLYGQMEAFMKVKLAMDIEMVLVFTIHQHKSIYIKELGKMGLSKVKDTLSTKISLFMKVYFKKIKEMV